MKSKSTRILLISILVISILLLIYNIGFQIDYMVIHKYTVDNGFPDKDIVFPKLERGAEINYLLLCSKIVLGYILLVICLILYSLFYIKRKNSW